MIKFSGNGQEWNITEQRLYSDNTPMIKPGAEALWAMAEDADSVTVQAGSLMEFVNAMFLVDAITKMGGIIQTLVLPYIPGARQDRINPHGDVLFTLASVAEMINNREFELVRVLDPHSPESGRQIRNMVSYPLEFVAAKMWQGYSGIIAADEGGKDRAEQFARAMDKDIYYGTKHRDPSNGRLSGFDVSVPEGGHYLVVDDICDGGGTFVGLAEQIAKCGAYADLYVSHGIFSKGTGPLLKHYSNIYSTDSRYFASDGVNIIKVVEDMERY